MKRLMVLTSVFAVVVAFATFSSPTQASDFGIHLAGRGYHVDIGRGHHGDGYYDGYRGYRSVGYGSGYGYGRRNFYGGGRVWHDTSHYDYHPGEFVPHGNHYHYIPGHYDYHETGHWDHYGW